jgi:Ca-activated chloride channel family protein
VVEVVSVANAVGGVRISNSEIPAAILNALARVALFKMQEKMVGDVKAGQIESATQRLEVMATRLAAIGEMGLARSAMLEAGHMARAGTLSPTGRKKMRYGTRALSMIPKEVDNG